MLSELDKGKYYMNGTRYRYTQ